MTGYVRPCKATLAPEDWDLYHSVYCGLCHTLASRYSLAATLSLRYDFVFFALLHAQSTMASRNKRCISHPVHSQVVAFGPSLELAADATVLFTDWKLKDTIRDETGAKRLGARAAGNLARHAIEFAKNSLPETAEKMHLEELALEGWEGQKQATIDRPASAFATTLGALSECWETDRRVVRSLLTHLGRWIYILDACDDLFEDTQKNRFNPIALRFEISDGILSQEHRSQVELTLAKTRGAILGALDLMEPFPYQRIVTNILEDGLRSAQHRVFDRK